MLSHQFIKKKMLVENLTGNVGHIEKDAREYIGGKKKVLIADIIMVLS